jgi:DNA-binding CsgD family transcriptional regulator
MAAIPLFMDRADERKTLGGLIEAARHGESGALVVYGDVGMGKTALLDLAASLTDLPAARISGVEAEQAFGFAALHRLLVPFMHQAGLLPPPQRTALETAFGLSQERPADLFMVGLAGLTLLAAEASESGLLCVIDDAQWIDTESLHALAFIGRRIRAEGLVLLFGLRTDFDLPPALAGIPTMEVGALPYDAAVELLDHAASRSMSDQVARRVVDETGGCPLALWELGKELAEANTTDDGIAFERLTISHRLEEHFSQQVAGLPPDTQLFLLVAAADTSGDRALVEQVARRLGCGADAEDAAERGRILVSGPDIRFRHPLIRSALYSRSDLLQRRRVHWALAEATPKNTHPDRWARHVVLSADGRSELLAGELEATSQLAQARGGYSAQATLLVHAANLSESLQSRSVRLLRAAGAALNAGMYPYASELLNQAEPYLLGPASIAEANHLRGRLCIGLLRPAKAPALLLAAAGSFLPLSMSGTRDVLLEALDAFAVACSLTSGISLTDILSVAETTTATTGSLTVQDHLLEGITAFFGTSRSRAYEHFRQAADLFRSEEVRDDQAPLRSNFVLMTMEMFDDATFNLWVARSESQARRHGALLDLVFILISHMTLDVRAGRLRAAASRHAEALDVAAAIGIPAEYLSMDDLERAWAGDEEGARAAASAQIEVATSIGSGITVINSRWALAVLHIGARRYEDALADTDFIRAQDLIGYPAQALPLAVEAAVRSVQRDKAERALADLESRATLSGTAWGLGLLARSRALLTESAKAEEHFEEAIGLLQQTSVATDVAHTRLLYGEWLRRETRRIDARAQLRMAHDFFADMGATGFAKRAETELLATGERARPRSIQTGESLTSQERLVAELAADGLSNMEIASQLFISSSTVEYHLKKVFRKLDVRSRGRLGKALRAQDLGPDS